MRIVISSLFKALTGTDVGANTSFRVSAETSDHRYSEGLTFEAEDVVQKDESFLAVEGLQGVEKAQVTPPAERSRATQHE